MSVMSIRIDNTKRKALKVIASIEGKSMGGIVSELIEDYIKKNKRTVWQGKSEWNNENVWKILYGMG